MIQLGRHRGHHTCNKLGGGLGLLYVWWPMWGPCGILNKTFDHLLSAAVCASASVPIARVEWISSSKFQAIFIIIIHIIFKKTKKTNKQTKQKKAPKISQK